MKNVNSNVMTANQRDLFPLVLPMFITLPSSLRSPGDFTDLANYAAALQRQPAVLISIITILKIYVKLVPCPFENFQIDLIGIREYLPVTILIDHDVVDGAPAARFASRLTELIESGHDLL